MSEEKSVEKTNSGVKKTGDWKEIAEFGEEVEDVVEDSADDSSVEKFNKWRPKVEESERDVKRKTVDEAVIPEKKMEKDSNGVKDLKEASGKAAEAGKKVAKRENPEPKIKDASKDAAKPFYSSIAKIFRKAENLVYSKIVLKLNPYYLDTQDFSADIKHKRKGQFEMDVSAPKEDLRKDLKEGFENDN
jgi:archaellum component FlaD/FlaE